MQRASFSIAAKITTLVFTLLGIGVLAAINILYQIRGASDEVVRSNELIAKGFEMVEKQVEATRKQRLVFEEQKAIASRDNAIAAATESFDKMRFWMSDYSVSWQTSSSEAVVQNSEDFIAALALMQSLQIEYPDDYETRLEELDSLMRSTAFLYMDEEWVEGNKGVIESLRIGRTLRDELRAMREQMAQQLVAKQLEADRLADQVGKQMASIESIVGEVLTAGGKATAKNAEAFSSAIAAQGVSLAIGSLLAFLMIRAICKPIQGMTETIRDIEQELDLTRRVNVRSQDEIGTTGSSLNNLLDRFAASISDVDLAATAIDSSTDQICRTTSDLNNSTLQQARSIRAITSSVLDISNSAQTSSQAADQANLLSKQAAQDAQDGVSEMSDLTHAMNLLDASSDEIMNITIAIDLIARQTNLLSLNASVEAARAGEHGRGFAIVAEEVRQLARRSSEAAKKSSQIIDASTKSVQQGIEICCRTGATLSKIARGTDEVNALLENISRSCSEQAAAIEEVSASVMEVEVETERTAEQTQVLTHATQHAGVEVGRLRSLVERFILAKAS